MFLLTVEYPIPGIATHTALLFCFVAMFLVFNPGLSFIQKLIDRLIIRNWNRFSSIHCMVPTIIIIIWEIKGTF